MPAVKSKTNPNTARLADQSHGDLPDFLPRERAPPRVQTQAVREERHGHLPIGNASEGETQRCVAMARRTRSPAASLKTINNQQVKPVSGSEGVYLRLREGAFPCVVDLRSIR